MGSGLDSGDNGDDSVIRHNDLVQLHLLGMCNARARGGRGGCTQVLKGALLIVQLHCHGGCWAQGVPWPLS